MRRLLTTLASLLLLAGLGALAACAQPTTGAGDHRGTGTTWPQGRTFWSTAVTTAGKVHSLVPGTRISTRFEAPGRIVANSGCNTLDVNATLDGDRLVAAQIAMTEMGCPQKLQGQDDWLAEFFTAGPTWSVSGDELTLTAGNAVIQLIDRRVADPDRPLVGTRWAVVGAISGDAASSLPTGSGFLQFTATTVTGTTVCQDFSGAAQIGPGSVVIGALHTTVTRPCPTADDAVNRAVMRVLHGTVTVAIIGPALTLTDDSGNGLMLQAEEPKPSPSPSHPE